MVTRRSQRAAGRWARSSCATRSRPEPHGSAQQLPAARAANDQIAGELRTLAARYRIDAIHTSKARPLPANPDEQHRLDAYEAARARLAARAIKLPRCTPREASGVGG